MYLQDHYGIPVVLREQGTTAVTCPYCGGKHDHIVQPGHHQAPCDDRGIVIVVGDRHFVPNYGYQIIEFRKGKGVNELISRLSLV